MTHQSGATPPPAAERLVLELLGPDTRLRGLLDAVGTAAGETDPRVTLRRILEAGRLLVEADYGALRVDAPAGQGVEFVSVGLDSLGPEVRVVPVPVPVPVPAPRHVPARPADETVTLPAGHPPVTAVLDVPVHAYGRTFGVLYLGGKRGGGSFTADDERLARGLATIVAFTVDSAQRAEEAKRRRAWLAAIAEITGALLSVAAPEDALGLVARRARQVTGADLAAIILPGEPGTRTVAFADGTGAAAVRGHVFPASAAPYAEPMRTGRAAEVGRSDGSGAGSRLFPGFDDPHGNVDSYDVDDPHEVDSQQAGGEQTGPAMILPLVAGGRVLGALVVAGTRDKRPFGELDLEMAAAFAGQAALALRMSRVQGERARLAVFEDRDRIARDLHDVVIQRVFATGLQVQALSRGLDGDPRRRLEAAVAELDRTIDDIRRTIFGLKAPSGDGGRLRAQIWDIAVQAGEGLGIRPDVRIEGAVDHGVPDRIHEHLLAALRELMSNIARHAQATAVNVLVRVTAADVLVEVRDNGRGPAGASRTSGLANLRARALELGGVMTFGPGRDGTGTTVTWTVPLR